MPMNGWMETCKDPFSQPNYASLKNTGYFSEAKLHDWNRKTRISVSVWGQFDELLKKTLNKTNCLFPHLQVRYLTPIESERQNRIRRPKGCVLVSM